MHSEVLIAACPGRLPRIECRGGIAARITGAGTVHLVSAAATPLGGDTIALRVIVAAGAALRLRSVAATVALPGPAVAGSSSSVDLQVGGRLDLDLEPTVVAAAARHRAAVVAELAETGELRLRERVQVGRSGEADGFFSGSLHVDVADGPLLRHRVELGDGAPGHDMIAAPLALVSELRYPTVQPGDPHRTVLALAGGGSLSTWQGRRLRG
ncbi:urease accessory protein UreD [Mycobacterium sp. MYCO198283]|uniref:urease accessory protein UreD n=1 Tax=Mycobacterium sp. MYCO198283 TaxID=2883505 RepID=UPI001E452FCB|nr:urease accessory protein UreD [Mycobacterium sp. MYCO198283]MCG5433207.1 urease accessory protein UreD [Mycobacterium sp. MYCO198283]